jgi:hypothetical protein
MAILRLDTSSLEATPRSTGENVPSPQPREPDVPRPDAEVAATPLEPAFKILFLDDDPRRAETFLEWYPVAVWVKTSAECIAQLAHGWNEVHLDHDLGGETFVDPSRSDCGMEVVRWLTAEFREPLREAQFVIHSHNVEAARLMVESLRRTGYQAHYRPFAVDLDDVITIEDVRELFREAGRRRRWSACRERLLPFLAAIGRFLRLEGVRPGARVSGSRSVAEEEPARRTAFPDRDESQPA